jgi:hypothetical protein
MNIEKYGNTNATLPLRFHDFEHLLKKGDTSYFC